MAENEIERIRKDLERHGFPLEIEVSQLLKKSEWNVVDKSYFADEETGKTREVDCVAMKGISTLKDFDLEKDFKAVIEQNLRSLRLVVECKKSVKPWVFHTTKNDFLSLFFTKSLGNLPIEILPKDEEGRSRAREFLMNLHSYFMKDVRLALNYYEPFTEGKGTQILDASMKVIKALRFDLKKLGKLVANQQLSNFLLIYYPTIVFEGNLYEFKFEGEESKISPIQFLQLNANYLDQAYRVDIVTSNFFPEYLKYLDNEIEGLKKFFNKAGLESSFPK